MQIHDPRGSELCSVQPAHAYLATLYALLGWKTTAKVLEVSVMRHVTKFNNGAVGQDSQSSACKENYTAFKTGDDKGDPPYSR